MFSFFKARSKAGIVGLEIRADGLGVALANTDSAGQLRISKCAYRDCNAAERKKTLNEIVSKYKLSGLPCNLVLPADQYQTYPIELPNVEPAEMADAARWKIKDMLDFDLEHAVTDVYDFPKDALRGRPDQLNVIVSRKAIIQGYVDLLADSDLELASIDVIDLALRNVARVSSGEDQRPTAILYLRPGAGMMVLVKGDTLYLARHFDFSMQALNEPAQQDSVIQHLALEVQRSFDYFESQMGQVPPQEIFLLGPDPSVPLANMLGGSIAAKVVMLDMKLFFDSGTTMGPDEIKAFAAMGGAMREATD